MKGWKNDRPDGWTGYHCNDLCIDCDTNPVDCNKHYEAGADAMYEELMKYRVKMPPDFTPILIVIPSEEAKE